MGLHTGEAELRQGDYFGTAVNRAAQLAAVGHGGQILCSAVTAGLTEGELGPLDLAEHRLRDLDRPMHVYQVGEGSFSPLRSLGSFPGNLPIQLTSFVGRQDEPAAVGNAFEAARLVALTGTGGVGKTRLGVQAAANLVTRFPDGVWLCELATAAETMSFASSRRGRPGLRTCAGRRPAARHRRLRRASPAARAVGQLRAPPGPSGGPRPSWRAAPMRPS
jgi:hypothetical protein